MCIRDSFLFESRQTQDAGPHIVPDLVVQTDFDVIQHRHIIEQSDILEGTCNTGLADKLGVLAGNVLACLLYTSLGTWSENAACFAAGETVVGIVRSVEEYGVFIEIAPNLAGLAEADSTLRPGQAVKMCIRDSL